MSSRDERLALNETMFREINERIEGRTGPDGADEPLTILCECANPRCAQRIALSSDEYAAVRADPRQFAVVPGHEYLELEEIVGRNDRYEIVRKTSVAGQVAEETSKDPPEGR